MHWHLFKSFLTRAPSVTKIFCRGVCPKPFTIPWYGCVERIMLARLSTFEMMEIVEACLPGDHGGKQDWLTSSPSQTQPEFWYKLLQMQKGTAKGRARTSASEAGQALLRVLQGSRLASQRWHEHSHHSSQRKMCLHREPFH